MSAEEKPGEHRSLNGVGGKREQRGDKPRIFSDMWNCVCMSDMKATRGLSGGRGRSVRRAGGKEGSQDRAHASYHDTGAWKCHNGALVSYTKVNGRQILSDRG